jgi:hypothetical protein
MHDTHLFRRGTIRSVRWFLMFLLALMAQPVQAAVVDPALVGIWETHAILDGRHWQFIYEIHPGGTFKFSSITEEGRYEASNGQWRVTAPTGYTDGGSYSFINHDTVSITGRLGTAVWARIQPAESGYGIVDPALVGMWQTRVVLDGAQWQFILEIRPTGEYRFTGVSTDGVYEAKGGHWKTVTQMGKEIRGTYTVLNFDAVSITGPQGTAVWGRKSGETENEP